jgi:hypothetical protein
MTQQAWDESQIHAYVDGELDAATVARIEADMQRDEMLAARIRQQRNLNRLLRAQFDPVLAEPVPQRLRETLGTPASGSVVTPIGAARPAPAPAARPRGALREWSAIAASLAVGALLGSLFFRASPEVPVEVRDGRLLASGDLEKALSGQVAAEVAADAPIRVTVSFRAAGGEYCRAFALQASRGAGGGLACRRGGGWEVEVLDGGGNRPAGPGEFRQAASGFSAAVAGAVSALGAGEALTPEEERLQRDSHWDAPGP